MFISPHINSIEKSAQRTLQNTSESPQQSLRVPIILFQNNSEISRTTFCDRTWMFSCMWGLSIHMDAWGHLIPVARKSKFELTLQICCENGIFVQHFQDCWNYLPTWRIIMCSNQYSIAILPYKRYIWYKVFPYLCIEWPKHQQSLILPLNHTKIK